MVRSCLLFAVLFLPLSLVSAESPVDRTAELKEIATEFGLCDGPAWDGGGSLFIPDVKGGKLYRYSPNQKKLSVVLPDAGRISATFYNHGRLYLSDNGNSGLAWLNGKDKSVIVANDPEAKPAQRPNDLVVDNRGGIYYTLTSTNQVMYVAPDGKQSVAVEKIETPNGITLSPDENTLYVSAYVPKQVYAYRIDAPGKTSGGKLFAVMDDGDAKGADGMSIDRAGNVYCAGATDVWIWSPSGKLLDKITPPTRPINCAFGDNDMRSLYITCFGGLYMQRMRISGDAPQPPAVAKFQPENASRPSTVIPDSIRAERDVVYATYGDRQLLMDVFVPKSKPGPKPAIVVVHGGGWLNGDKTKFRALAIDLANRGYVTAAIEYRLGDEARFPAGIHDCNASVRFLRANAGKYEIDSDRIGAVGGSAGGHLVGLMATGHGLSALEGDGGNGNFSSKLQAAIVMAGPMEITTGSVLERSRQSPEQSNAVRWIGPVDEAWENYQLADAHLHITADDCSILFMVGEHDKPARNQPSRDKLKAAGVWTDVKVYKDGKHGCWNQLPWFNDMVADMDVFFQVELKWQK